MILNDRFHYIFFFSKYRYNATVLFEITRYHSSIELIEKIIESGDFVLAGSSWGGLACALAAQRKPTKIKGLLLLAPALHYPEHPNNNPENLIAPENIPVIIIHSTTDDIVPISASKDYLERSKENVKLIEVDDNHVLENSIELIISETKKLLNH